MHSAQHEARIAFNSKRTFLFYDYADRLEHFLIFTAKVIEEKDKSCNCRLWLVVNHLIY